MIIPQNIIGLLIMFEKNFALSPQTILVVQLFYTSQSNINRMNNIFFVGLFDCVGFNVPLENFSLTWRLTITSEGLLILNSTRHSWPLMTTSNIRKVWNLKEKKHLKRDNNARCTWMQRFGARNSQELSTCTRNSV